jgi:hypothetical protein
MRSSIQIKKNKDDLIDKSNEECPFSKCGRKFVSLD